RPPHSPQIENGEPRSAWNPIVWSQNILQFPSRITGSSTTAAVTRKASAYAQNATGPGRSRCPPRGTASTGVRASSGASASGANFVSPASAATPPRASGREATSSEQTTSSATSASLPLVLET